MKKLLMATVLASSALATVAQAATYSLSDVSSESRPPGAGYTLTYLPVNNTADFAVAGTTLNVAIDLSWDGTTGGGYQTGQGYTYTADWSIVLTGGFGGGQNFDMTPSGYFGPLPVVTASNINCGGAADCSLVLGENMGIEGGSTTAVNAANLTPNSPEFSFTLRYFNPESLYQNDTTLTFTDVTPAVVPVPAAAWLFGSALVGLAGVGRKRKAV